MLYFYYKYIISNRKIILFIGLLGVYEVSMWSDTKIKFIHTTVMNTIELYTNNMIHDFLLQCWLIVCVLLQWAVSWRAARRGSEVCYAQSRPRPRSRAAASHPWDCPHRPRHGQYNTTHYVLIVLHTTLRKCLFYKESKSCLIPVYRGTRMSCLSIGLNNSTQCISHNNFGEIFELLY